VNPTPRAEAVSPACTAPEPIGNCLAMLPGARRLAEPGKHPAVL